MIDFAFRKLRLFVCCLVALAMSPAIGAAQTTEPFVPAPSTASAIAVPATPGAASSPAATASAPAPAPEAIAPHSEIDDARFEALAHRYWYGLFALSPSFATGTGFHAYDSELDSASAAYHEKLLSRDRAFLAELARFSPARLSADDAFDRTLLQNGLNDDLLINGTLAEWKHNPDACVGGASGSIYSLIERPFAPPAVRLHSVIAREDAIPRYLAECRAALTTVDATTAAVAYDDASGSASFFTSDVPSAMAGVGTAADRAAFAASTRTAVAALASFTAFIKAGPLAHPSGTFAIGADAYRKRLRYEEGLDIPLDRYLAVGVRAFDDTRARLIATAKAIDPKASVEDVIARLQKKHPTTAGVIPAAQQDLVRLRRFIVTHHILTLPADADIRVTLTPAFERAVVFAQEDSPGALERVATRAYYNVTPPDSHDPPAMQESVLESLNDYERPIISAHEVYPGHFTNFAVDRHLKLSLTRQLLTATSFVEGWAHYCEQMVVDQGWGDGDPRVRLMQLDEAILRNARFIVGVKLHTQGMTVQQATDFFRHDAYQTAATARGEARRGTSDATYGYYTLGKLEILKLRADYRTKLGSAFTLQRFHDELLSRGDSPIPMLRPLILGSADDGKVL